MLSFDNIRVGFSYDTLEQAKGMPVPIAIEDQDDGDGCVIELSLDQARWLRDNIDYVIKKLED